jgi:hypothetical protein
MKHHTWLVAGALGAAATTSSAEPAPPASDGATSAQQLTLPKGRWLLGVTAELNLSADQVGKPFSLGPDVWYGETDHLTVGLVHTAAARTGFASGYGSSLCLSGQSNGCAHVYDNVGLVARYEPSHGALAWAFDGGVLAQSFDPFQLALKLGATAHWQAGAAAIEAAPALFVGVTNREPVGGKANLDAIELPITCFYGFAPRLTGSLQSGVALPLQHTGAAWAIPLSLGAHVLATDKLRVSLAFSLTHLVGGDAFKTTSGVDGRALTLGGAYAF